VLGVAAATGDVARAAWLLGAYSLGLAVPFLATAFFFGKLSGALAWFNRHSEGINRAAGVVLVVFGILIATGQLGRLSALLITVFPFLGELG
jgi:cytochrome c-type biogenesis protein